MRGTYRYKAPKIQDIQRKGLEAATSYDFFYIPQNSIKQRLKTLSLDFSILYFVSFNIFALFVQAQKSFISPYAKIQGASYALTIAVSFALPFLFLSTLIYFGFSYFYGNSSLGGKWYKSLVVDFDFCIDGEQREYKLSLNQVLRRSFALFLNFSLLGLPSLITFIDPFKRNFADIFSHSITITQDEFVDIFHSKGSLHFQLLIDIESLEDKEEQPAEFQQAA